MIGAFASPAMHAAQNRIRKWMSDNPAKFRRMRRASQILAEGRSRARRDTRDRPSR